MNSLVKKIDIFGRKIELTHNGTHEFKTVFGGVITIGLVLWLLTMASTGLIRVFTSDIETLFEEIRWYDVDQDVMFNPGQLKFSKEHGLDMAIGFTGGTVLNESIGHWEMKYVQEVNGTENVTQLEMFSCRENLKKPDFNHPNVKTYSERLLKNMPIESQ